MEHKVLHLCSLPSRGFTPQMTQKNFHCVLCSSYGLSYICGQDLGYGFKIIINAPGLHHPCGSKPPRSLFYGRMGWMPLCGDTGALDDFCFQAGNGEFESELLTMTQLVGAIMNGNRVLFSSANKRVNATKYSCLPCCHLVFISKYAVELNPV